MKDEIVKAKLHYFDKRSQYIVFNQEGIVQDSCNSLFTPSSTTSLFQQIPFLEGMESSLKMLETNKDLRFLCIHTSLLDVEGYFNFVFKRQAQGEFLWFIYDFTELYTFLLPWQQERNEHAIESEHLLAQQKADEIEKQLLQYQNEELKRIQEMKTIFFSQVSHEIRTPLHSLIGLINLIEPSGKQENRSYITAMRSVSDHLASIINDVLDLTKLETGEIHIQEAVFSLESEVKKLTQALLYRSHEKGISLAYEIDNNLPAWVKGDATRLSQILYNLLGNAIKFTNHGKVSLSVKPVKQSAEEVLVSFIVTDTGIGISQEGLKKIFTPFVQASEDTHRYYGGTGLGLSIVQKLVHLLSGKIDISSKLNEGTQIRVDLPFAVPAQNEHLDKVNIPDEAGKFNLSYVKKVLIGEDDLMNQKVLSLLLQRWGMQTHVENNGKEVLKCLEQQTFDMLIVDYQMPEMNGLEVLRQMEEKHLNTPVILLSGNLLKDQKIPQREGSLTFTLHKPVQVNDLQHKLSMIDLSLAKAVDLEYLHQITDSNTTLMSELIDTFVAQAPVALEKIKASYHQKDYAALYSAVHKAKPGFQCIGPAEINSLLDKFEDEVEEQRAQERYQDTIQLIESWACTAIEYINTNRKELLEERN